jgi:flagellar biosynthesis protein FlhB
MADFRQPEDDAASRTEAPSAQRRDAARRAGDVPRSDEFSNWFTLALLTGALALLGGVVWQSLTGLFEVALKDAHEPWSAALDDALRAPLGLLAIVLAVIFAAQLVAPWLQSGWVWVRGREGNARPGLLARLAGGQSAYAVARVALKCLIATGLAVLALDALPRPADTAAGLAQAAVQPLQTALFGLLTALAALAVLDAGWQWWRWWRRNAMSWPAAQADAQAEEVSPQIRAALWQRRRAPDAAKTPGAGS